MQNILFSMSLLQACHVLSGVASQNLVDWSAKRFSRELEVPHFFLVQLFTIEDKRFILHLGLDPVAIIRATLINIKYGGIYEGASTITQQLYNAQQESNGNKLKRGFSSKLRQTVWALVKDASTSKIEILSAYLKTVYWGRLYYGIDEAASGYFNTTRDKLTIAQSFFLAERIALPNLANIQRIATIINQPTILSIFSQNISSLDELIKIYDERFKCGDKLGTTYSVA